MTGDVHRIELTDPGSLGVYYRRALFARKPGLAAGATLDRFEVRANGVETDLARLRRYRMVCGFLDDRIVPVTWPQVLAAPVHAALLTSEAFPLPLLGLVHVASQIQRHRRLEVGAPVDLFCHVEGHRDVARGVELDLHTAVGAPDDPSWTSVTTILAKTKKAKGRGQLRGPSLPGLEPGLDRSAIWTIRADQGRRYASVSGDYNPIHLYGPTARLFGYTRPIVHGMWSLARCIAELEEGFGDDEADIYARFKTPIRLPSRVAFSSGTTPDGLSFRLSSVDGSRPHVEGAIALRGGAESVLERTLERI